MCHVETSESLEGIVPSGLINRGKRPFWKDSIYYINWLVKATVFWRHTSSLWNLMEVFLQRTLACGTRYGIEMFCLTEAGEQQIDWVPEKDWATLERHVIY